MIFCGLLTAFLLVVVEATPLDDYVNKPDPTYTYRDLGSPFRGDGYTSYFINLTSQTWLSPQAVSQSVWWHYLVINIPDKVEFTDTAMIYITGGSNTGSRPDITSEDCLISILMAIGTGTVTATLFQIPNQPIVFQADPARKERSEDTLVAFTWYYYMLHTDDPEYLSYLPMTKAAVRAMDAVTDFAATKNPDIKISKFFVGGASKRGWTTWLVAAVDKRVIAAYPIVMDLLNLTTNMHHWYRAYGGWSFAMKSYWELNITKNVDTANMQKLADIVDPYVYIDRLTMPKLLISAGGDEYFLPDDSYYFWNALQGETFVRMIPNAEHSCVGHFVSIEFAVRAFYLSLLLNASRPTMTWTMNHTEDTGFITMKASTKPSSVLVYHATTLTSKRRDFRLARKADDSDRPVLQPVVWFSENLDPQPTGEYVAEVSQPEEGWTAFFIQATFPGPRDSIYEFTTQVNIVPNTFPFPECKDSGCRGTLV